MPLPAARGRFVLLALRELSEEVNRCLSLYLEKNASPASARPRSLACPRVSRMPRRKTCEHTCGSLARVSEQHLDGDSCLSQ